MYDLGIGLTYENTITLSSDFRYDFLSFDFDLHHFNNGPIGSDVFVFRTITKYGKIGNVLVDLINQCNVNGFDAALHPDTHFHNIKTDDLLELKYIALNDSISIEVKNGELCSQFLACINNQTIEKFDMLGGSQITPNVNVEYLLFEKCDTSLMNKNKIELAPIFEAQKNHIWHNNRAQNFNTLIKWDINDKMDESTSWINVKKGIETNREYWRKEQQYAFDGLLKIRERLGFKVLER
ncbi:hypothetical protein [Paenibacillus polymyxa]|uniref:hypothetical protein n=1 Tax=Paenibacillus polymyxa TaxID=1406 RepID=UPI00058A0610|nr:hypothetical protein [Paenibacillus polymyxa]AJE54289.1 hypothetical protein RE92_25215 [Paenibacillus polymyxa]